jgi:predicted nucleotidyltransferase
MLTTHEICAKAKPVFLQRPAITGVNLFGSFARGTANEKSDLDFLIDLDPESRFGLGDLAQLITDLESTFSRKVDVVTRRSIIEPEWQESILNGPLISILPEKHL